VGQIKDYCDDSRQKRKLFRNNIFVTAPAITEMHINFKDKVSYGQLKLCTVKVFCELLT
jgi:hypothetical protein